MMYEWIVVLALVILGIVFLVGEIIVIPGTTIIGIVGLILTTYGIYLSFDYFGNTIGSVFTIFSTTCFFAIFYFGLKSKTWERFSLKSSNKSKFNEGLFDKLSEGEVGLALSDLKPFGKGEFAGREYEVKTQGQFLDSGTGIRIMKIDGNSVLVEPINN